MLAAAQEFDLVVADWGMVSQDGSAQQEHALGHRFLWIAGDPGGPASAQMPPNSAMLRKPFTSDELLAAVEARLVGTAAPILRE